MSKIITQSLIVLALLFVLSLGMFGWTWMQKAQVETQNQALQTQLGESTDKARGLEQQIKKLSDESQGLRKDIEQKIRDIDAANKKFDEARRASDRVTEDLTRAQRDRTDIESRMNTLRSERDDLIAKLKVRPVEEKIVEKEKIVYRDRLVDANGNPVDLNAPPAPVVPPAYAAQPQAPVQQQAQTNVVIENTANEEYWAGIMRQKAALELELVDVKRKLSEKDIKTEELKKTNSDLEIEIGRLKNEREEIVRKIKYGDDLADSLSIELARARNEGKIISDRADRVSTENQGLRTDIKQLSATKVALEKSIARLSDDKTAVERKLAETENIIQGRIDEIWKIKKDVDTRFDMTRSNAGEVELAPIVVNAAAAPVKTAPANAPRRTGNVVSVNEENNFVVIDMGEADNIHTGDTFKIYRGKDQIGSVAVIQVRKDISAADIKQKVSAFKAGDQVR
ncbi:MAG: hypothetical protein HQL20_08705 [Candidatus Omnitrophica bacterium]|nr:hypothetical protein [Candidatus Omnitrophota bacterium]